MSGSVPAIWTQTRGWSRDLRRATMQVYNIAMHVFTLTVYSRTGGFRDLDYRIFVIAAPAMLIPAWFGAKLYHRVSERVFQRIVLALLLAVRPCAALRGGALSRMDQVKDGIHDRKRR